MLENSPPTISVVIAARNASAFIAATLKSLVDQAVPVDQVVVYDDGSSDDTADIAESFSGQLPELTVIRGGTTVGISSARNRANAAANSDYIAVLDADDLFGPEAIRCYVDFLAENPATDLLYADTRVFEDKMNKPGKARRYPQFSSARQAIRRTLGSPLIPFKHSSMVYRRAAIEELGGYDETLPIKVDVDLFLRFHQRGKNVAKLHRTTSYHRKHAHQISTRRMRGIKAYARLLNAYEPHLLVRGFLYSTRIPSELLKMLVRG